MQHVFRVEHSITRQGPFQTNDPFTQMLAKMAISDPALKSPGQDGLPLGDVPFCFVFGCIGLESLRDWFLLGDCESSNEEIVEKLGSLGFRVGEYLVEEDDCWVSDSGVQAAFHASICREDGLVTYHNVDILLRTLVPELAQPIILSRNANRDLLCCFNELASGIL